MTWNELIDGLQRHPLMYLQEGSFVEAWAYVLGFDAGKDDDVVERCRLHLADRHPEQANYSAASLLLIDSLDGVSNASALTPAQNHLAVRSMLDLLQEVANK